MRMVYLSDIHTQVHLSDICLVSAFAFPRLVYLVVRRLNDTLHNTHTHIQVDYLLLNYKKDVDMQQQDSTS
jgi:hypothetical protein